MSNSWLCVFFLFLNGIYLLLISESIQMNNKDSEIVFIPNLQGFLRKCSKIRVVFCIPLTQLSIFYVWHDT